MRPEAIRKRVLAEWRGLPDQSEKPEKVVSVPDALKKLLPKLGLTARLDEQQVLAAWRELVGDFLADNSTPVSLHAGVLTVRVLQPSVRYELDRSWKPEVLRKLQARFGKSIREVKFRG